VIFNFPFEVEHITPRAHAGADDLNNPALACRSCNLFKWQRTTGFDDFDKCWPNDGTMSPNE
jgi:5-methylcytosine-specific restriction endonuclease McrA